MDLFSRKLGLLRSKFVMQFGAALVSLSLLVSLVIQPPKAKAVAVADDLFMAAVILSVAVYGGWQITASNMDIPTFADALEPHLRAFNKKVGSTAENAWEGFRNYCQIYNFEDYIHDTGSGNPHAHILLTMRPMDAQGKWLPKSKKEYVLDENGARIRLSSGRYKTRRVDLVDWNSQENAEVWRKVWADLANEFLERNNCPERIDHRSYERQGIDQLPTVHIGVAASQMEKKGIATERGELNRSIKAANRLLRDIKAQIGKLKEWLLDVFKAKESLRAEPPQPKSPDLSTLLFRYLDIQKAKGRKYSQSWQQQHSADELKAISKAVNLLSEKGIYTLEELDAALSVVHDKASEIRSGMKPRETRIRQLQKLIEQAQNLRETQPIHDEYKQIRWKGKQEKFAEAHRADLAIWDAANRYLRANLPDMKLTPKAWQTELAALTAENEAEYAKLKAQREEVTELQKVRRYVDVALKADAPQKTKTKHHDIDR